MFSHDPPIHDPRSAVKIHRRAFVSCSRGKACNFSGFVNISSETFLEKRSPLNELRNYGDRWGKLRRLRKHQSHQAAHLRSSSYFLWPIRSGQFKCFWIWFGKSKCPGARLDLTVNFHYGHFIDPTNCPWVSQDRYYAAIFLHTLTLPCVHNMKYAIQHPCKGQ